MHHHQCVAVGQFHAHAVSLLMTCVVAGASSDGLPETVNLVVVAGRHTDPIVPNAGPDSSLRPKTAKLRFQKRSKHLVVCQSVTKRRTVIDVFDYPP